MEHGALVRVRGSVEGSVELYVEMHGEMYAETYVEMYAEMYGDMSAGIYVDVGSMSISISALSRHHRRHAHTRAMGMPSATPI